MAKEIRLTAEVITMQRNNVLRGRKWGNTIVFRGHPALVVASYMGCYPQRDKDGQLYTTMTYDGDLDVISPRLVKAGYCLAIDLD